ncbi:MAG TPA: type II secretion system secretin GspD [Desulfobaccales bacterium]
MQGYSGMAEGEHLKAGWLPGILTFCLIAGLMGCAPAQVTTPSPPLIRQVPVRVSTAPVKPESKYAPKEKRPPTGDTFGDERGMERYAARLKEIPTSRRVPKKGEKVYPIDLNLKNADLVEAVRVLADTMGINYSIDPKVKGTVNVRATGNLTQSDLMSIMETLLAINGAVLIKGPELYKIVPLDKAATRALPVHISGPVPPGMRAQVVFLEQTAAKEMVSVLKPLLSAGGNLGETAHNALILVDSPDNLDKLLQLIHLVDTRALAQTLVRIIKVHNTDPKEIITEMETIFSAYGTLAQKEKGKFGVGFLPVSRINSVMILASSPGLMERALYWTKQLDMKTDLLANIHVYNVVNYRAKNLANILTQVYGGTAAAPTVKETKPEAAPAFGASAFGGTGGMGGAQRTTTGMGGVGTTTGTTGLGAGGLQPQAAPGAEAAGAPALKERAVAGAGAPGAAPKEGVRIIPDEENNLLVVVAPPHEWNIISRILKELDIMPRQVLNEVLIAEVRLTDELKYGIEFLLGAVPAAPATSTGTTTGGTTPSGLLVAGGQQTTVTGPAGQTGTVSTAPTTVQGVTVDSAASAFFTTASGFTFVALDTVNKLRGLINLLASQGKVNILASPHIMAANNQEAKIMIGEEVPILTSSSVPLISQATSFQTSTVQYRNTGIILSVKPQINARGLVTLEISQEVSDAKGTTTGVGGTPTFTVRQAKTQLITGDNQTVVLGGLIREDRTLTSAGIPGLRKLPLLGPLFGSEGVSKQKTELLVLITPHIITNLEEGARITHDMKEKVGLEEPSPQHREIQRPPEAAPHTY